jgi:hypothetical protein
MEATLDGCFTIAAYLGYAPNNNCGEHRREYNSAVAFTSVSAQIKSPSGNNPHSFRIYGQIYNFCSTLCPNEAKKPGYTA